MIDATKSPVPAWKRYAVAGLLVMLIAVVGYMLWTKELHHSSSSASGSTPAATATVSHSTTTVKTTPSTTIPGGIPISSRNPFGG